MNELTLDQAIEQAIYLNSEVKRNGPSAGFQQLDEAVAQFKMNHSINMILPDSGEGLGFSAQDADGKTFFKIYGNLIRESMCGKNGELGKLVKSGLSTSVGAVLTTIVVSLSIPAVALGIMIPIAAIIVNTGVDAFCAMSQKEED